MKTNKSETRSLNGLFDVLDDLIEVAKLRSFDPKKKAKKTKNQISWSHVLLKAINSYGTLFSQYKLENLQLQLDELKQNFRKRELKH